MKVVLLTLLLLPFTLFSDLKSTSGTIEFNSNDDSHAEMTLNTTGLGIGVTPSANLHVSGNIMVTEKIYVRENSGSSDLNIHGSIGFGVEAVTSSTTLSGNSLVLADTTGGNIILSLPEASTLPFRKYTIKKISSLNKLYIRDGGFIDEYTDLSLAENSRGTLSVISHSGNWHILNMSDNGTVLASDNLVGWWKFDEPSGNESSDSSLLRNDATISGMVADNIGITGLMGRGLDFDGVDDLVSTAGDDDNLDPQEITVSAWLNVPSNTAGNFVNKGDNGGYRIRTVSGLKIQVLVVGGTNTLTTSSTLTANSWTHFVFTGDASGLKLYLNGSLDASKVNAYNAPNTAKELVFGRYATSEYFEGKLDDVRIYNRALSASEILSLYQQGF